MKLPRDNKSIIPVLSASTRTSQKTLFGSPIGRMQTVGELTGKPNASLKAIAQEVIAERALGVQNLSDMNMVF